MILNYNSKKAHVGQKKKTQGPKKRTRVAKTGYSSLSTFGATRFLLRLIILRDMNNFVFVW